MIGVFDSGVGGLTVVRALLQSVPTSVELVYLGDTARVPYGSKSPATVARYSKMAARFLTDRGVELLVVACNTASAFALDELRASLSIPVIGVIEPGARGAAAVSAAGHIGVIGTLGTVRSGAYERAIAAIAPVAVVTSHACPLLVPLAEEGWLDGDPIADAVVRRYLEELRAKDPLLDTLVLGCTHYPLLKPNIARISEEVFGRAVTLVDSGEAVAAPVAAALPAVATDKLERRLLRCFVTDEARFAEVGSRFLGRPLDHVEKVDL
jgi:glutamate racemase